MYKTKHIRIPTSYLVLTNITYFLGVVLGIRQKNHTRDYYKILQVDPKASEGDIKRVRNLSCILTHILRQKLDYSKYLPFESIYRFWFERGQ